MMSRPVCNPAGDWKGKIRLRVKRCYLHFGEWLLPNCWSGPCQCFSWISMDIMDFLGCLRKSYRYQQWISWMDTQFGYIVKWSCNLSSWSSNSSSWLSLWFVLTSAITLSFSFAHAHFESALYFISYSSESPCLLLMLKGCIPKH